MMDCSVQVVSTHPLVPLLLARALALHESIKLLPAISKPAADGDDAPLDDPRVFVLDSCSLGQSVNPFSRRLRFRFPRSKFLALGPPGEASEGDLLQLLYSGINGWVTCSDRIGEELPLAIRAVVAGDFWVPQRVVEEYVRQTTRVFDVQVSRKLTAREHQVFQLMVRRLSNREIGEALDISERTVKFHVSNLFDKIGVEDRRQLLRVPEATPLRAAL